MGWKVLNNREKIVKIMEELTSRKAEVKVYFNKEETGFTSRFLKIREVGESPGNEIIKDMIFEKLIPERGNTLIQSYSEAIVEFVFAKTRCRCSVKFSGVSNTYPHFGIVLSLPEAIRIEEKRREERFVYEMPDFVSAEFRLGKASDEKLYELAVMDCSRHGLGLIISKKDRDLLSLLNVGDRIEDISFYATWSMIKVSGTVKHITLLEEEGQYRGCHLLGIESPEIIENFRPVSN